MRSIVWCGPTFQPTGYADEVRGMALALHAVGTEITLVPPALESSATFRNSLDPASRRVLEQCVERTVAPGFIQVQHGTIDSFSSANEHAAYSIGRSMFETDSLPSHWVVGANALDELWVPGEFNRQTFAKAGVRTPMHVIPGGIDSQTFRPDIAPMPLPGARGTVFLSVFEWRLRKGWDVLLRAWADAFTSDDDVTLVLRTYPISRVDGLDNATVIGQYIDEYLQSHCGGRSRADVAPIVILGDPVPAQQLPSLYTAAHAFVLPTRGEGWGRPFMESMACGVPVVATNWSAHLAFLNNDNGYLIDIDGSETADFGEVPSYAGQRWASPSATHLAALLQRVHRDRAEALHLGLRARRDMVEEWPWSRVADAISTRLNAIHAQLDDVQTAHTPTAVAGSTSTPKTSGAVMVIESPNPQSLLPPHSTIQWLAAAAAEGARVDGVSEDAAAVVWRVANRGTRPRYDDERFPFWRDANQRIAQCGTNARVQVTILDHRGASELPTPPTRGMWIVDTGSTITNSVPPQFIMLLRDCADIVVVPTEAAETHCLRAGVHAQRIRVIPFGVDQHRLISCTAALRHSGTATTRFLLLGEDRAHKDWSRAIAAYDRAFTAADDVLLRIVVPQVRYAPMSATLHRLITQIQDGKRHPRLPRIVVHRDAVHHDEMPAVFRSADVLLHPGAISVTGRTVCEALASGMTVLACANDATRALAGHENIVLVPMDTHHRVDQAVLQNAMQTASQQVAQRTAIRTETASAAPVVRDAAETLCQLALPTVANQVALMVTLLSHAKHVSRTSLRVRANGDHPPVTPEPFHLAGARRVVIMAHGNWHTGMAQAIVRTFATACTTRDDVTLALLLDPAQQVSTQQAKEMIRDALRASNCPADTAPDLLLVTDHLTDAVLHRLRAVASIVVAIRDQTAAAHARRANRAVVTSLDPREWRATVAGQLPAACAAEPHAFSFIRT